MKKILLGKPEFNTWMKYFNTLIDKYPNNILMFDFIDENNINKLIKTHNIDIIIPLSFSDMELLSNSNIDCYYLSSKNFDIISMLNDKSKFVKYFMENNLEKYLPKTYYIYLDNIKYVYYENIEFPAIQKSNIGFGGSNIYIINNSNDIKKMDNYILQKYIKDNNEYTAHIISKNGNIIFYKFFKEIHQKDYYIQCGPMNNFEIVDFDINLFKPIFDKLKYDGACCINFKYINNQIYIFEINPRFGGTLINYYIFMDFFDDLLNSDELEF
jgi:carbamoylphosphate synthase large subunit